MRKASEINELINEVMESAKERVIKEDTQLVEIAIESLCQDIMIGNRARKFAVINKELCNEVAEDLVKNQGYYIDVNCEGQTYIYYNEEDFNNRVMVPNFSGFEKVEEIDCSAEDLNRWIGMVRSGLKAEDEDERGFDELGLEDDDDDWDDEDMLDEGLENYENELGDIINRLRDQFFKNENEDKDK